MFQSLDACGQAVSRGDEVFEKVAEIAAMRGAETSAYTNLYTCVFENPRSTGGFKSRSFWLVDLFLAESAPKNGKSRTEG